MKPYYDHGGITIYHGDCRDVLPNLGLFACMMTDPPFSEHTHSNAKSNRGRIHAKKSIDFSSIDFSSIETLLGLASVCIDRWVISTMDWRHIAEIERRGDVHGWELVRFGVWVKTNPMPQISADRPANGWDGIAYVHRPGKKSWNGGGLHGNYIGPVVSDGLHPTGKPVRMLHQWIERFTDVGEAILDPFAGSGTTGRAAKDLGRKATLIEIEEKYCEIAAKRLMQEVLPL